jgi:hypothetical protein
MYIEFERVILDVQQLYLYHDVASVYLDYFSVLPFDQQCLIDFSCHCRTLPFGKKDLQTVGQLLKKYDQYHAKFFQSDNSKRPSTIFHGHDLAEWLERLTANAEVATVLGSFPDSPTQWTGR